MNLSFRRGSNLCTRPWSWATTCAAHNTVADSDRYSFSSYDVRPQNKHVSELFSLLGADHA